MKKRCSSICFCLLLCFFLQFQTMAAFGAEPTLSDEQAKVVYGGVDVFAAMRAAKEMQASIIEDHKIVSGPKPVGAADLATLQATLSNGDIISGPIGKGCIPLYGVRVDFAHGEKTISLLFCFQCRMIDVFSDGKKLGGGDFDEGEKDLRLIFHKLFPDVEKLR